MEVRDELVRSAALESGSELLKLYELIAQKLSQGAALQVVAAIDLGNANR
jgi:hypothetical protein